MLEKKTLITVCVMAFALATCAPVVADSIDMVMPDNVVVSGYNGSTSFTGTLDLFGGGTNAEIGFGGATNPANLEVAGSLTFFFGFFQSGSIMVTDLDSDASYTANVYGGSLLGNIAGMQFAGYTDQGVFSDDQFGGLNVTSDPNSDLTGTMFDFLLTFDRANPGPSFTTLAVTVDDPGANNGPAHAPVPSAVAAGMMMLVGLVASCWPRKCLPS